MEKKQEYATRNHCNCSVPSPKFSKEKKVCLIYTKYTIIRLGKQRPKAEVTKINLKDLFEKQNIYLKKNQPNKRKNNPSNRR